MGGHLSQWFAMQAFMESHPVVHITCPVPFWERVYTLLASEDFAAEFAKALSLQVLRARLAQEDHATWSMRFVEEGIINMLSD